MVTDDAEINIPATFKNGQELYVYACILFGSWASLATGSWYAALHNSPLLGYSAANTVRTKGVLFMVELLL
jgi:hypothetical protein